MTTMRRAMLAAPEDLRLEEVEIPRLEPGDALVKVGSALLCGTDVKIYTGRKKRNVSFPTVLGHEFSGTVVEATAELPNGLSVGDQVAVYPLVPCGRCTACTRGHENICNQRVAFGYQLPGGLSQYVRVPAAAIGNLIPVPGRSPAEAAVIEPIACAYNAQKLADVDRAANALVVGCGPLGLIHTRLAKQLGVGRIAAVDPIGFRREAALASGADAVFEPGPGTPAEVLDWSDGGIDLLIMAVGRPDALHPYLGCLGPGARVSVFAGFGQEADLVIPANDIHYREWKVVGASSCRLEGFTAVADLVASGRLPVADLIGTQYGLDKVPEAIERVASGQDMRVGVLPWS